jgi:AcrR family transcriptional regulator
LRRSLIKEMIEPALIQSLGSPPPTLGVRKRQATRDRIAACAARLVAETGLSGTTVERIAAEADVGRATFFRYFSSKEDAVADGMTRHWLDVITGQIACQPPELSAVEAVVAAFGELGDDFDAIRQQVHDLATLTRSSPALNAWTLQIYVGYESAIADLVAPRLPDLRPDDPRPRLIGAMAMASVRIALDDWLRDGGSLPQRVHTALSAMAVQ